MLSMRSIWERTPLSREAAANDRFACTSALYQCHHATYQCAAPRTAIPMLSASIPIHSTSAQPQRYPCLVPVTASSTSPGTSIPVLGTSARREAVGG
eukprot:3940858-Rhodomonas_salina.1